MKRIIITVIVLIIFFAPRIYWQLKDQQEIDVLVIDKTVPTMEYREHKGLFWFLTNEKIVKPNGELYDIGIDYHGYDPYEGKAMEDLQFEHEKDLIYVADTYGVYTDDLEEHVEGNRSEKLYGGLDLLEWSTILQSKGTGTTLVAEYNTFATPTEAETAKIVGENLSVNWTQWIGRYFSDLNSEEVPAWLIANYEKQYDKKWSFKQGGLAFVHTSDKVIVIDEKELNEKVMFKTTKLGKSKMPEVEDADYRYWFDIVEPLEGAEVLAQFELNVSKAAREELQQAGISTTFPAVTHHENNKTYYFSGDFADYTKDNMKKWQRGDTVMKIFSNDESNFFWASYIPLMRHIVDEM